MLGGNAILEQYKAILLVATVVSILECVHIGCHRLPIVWRRDPAVPF
jgi:hypothetical protein